MLQGLHLDIYRFLVNNPGSTRAEVTKSLDLRMSSATARIKELIDEGYLFEPPGIRKENPSGVRAKVLRVTDRPHGGKPLDKVRIELLLTIDCDGRYGVTASVVNGAPQQGPSNVIKKQRVTVTAPHPATYASTTDNSSVTPVSRMEIEAHGDDIIDAPFYEISE